MRGPQAAHVGIVACSAEGAALCYRTLCAEGADRLGRHDHPEVSLHTHSLARYMACIDAGDWDGVAALMGDSATRLARVGATFAICPDNTIHQVFDRAAALSPIPWLHIVDAVGRAAAEAGFGRLGLLGTRFLMEGPVYPDRLGGEVELLIPPPDARARIHAHIFDELVYGVVTDAARRFFVDIVAALGVRGCDAVVLGCTEIPLLIRPGDSPLPTLDSTRLLARAALDAAVPQGPSLRKRSR